MFDDDLPAGESKSPAGDEVREPPESESDTGADAGRDTGRLEWPLWEVFVRGRHGMSHRHVGSLHATDAQMALKNARDVYTRRREGVSIWVVESRAITASIPADKEAFFDSSETKIYRHPSFYDIPDEAGAM
ncbi:1,2-phenylacetyl-CoA epoxidase subunit PaaB [Thioalkalivibrio sp. HK1]|uniref:1,2-phenylacetyl-CoA epoxidase subunit PaaB n=1 Tax=Thioalkalivibrio sp. HK1 TaxID=1469245 RepID=UPI000472A05A